MQRTIPSRRAAVFMALDGTISENGQPPSPRMAAALRTMRRNGHLIYFCTGRALCEVGEEYRRIGYDGLVTLAGAYVEAGGRRLCQAVWPRDLTRAVLGICEEESINCIFESNTQVIQFSPSGQSHWRHTPIVRSAKELQETQPGFQISKMVLHHTFMPRFQAHRAQYAGQLTFLDSAATASEITLTGFDKGTGIRRILDYLGRDLADSFGIGDSENDIGMLDTVETAIAMGNAMEQLKSHADYVTSTVGEDGAYWAFRHFGLL